MISTLLDLIPDDLKSRARDAVVDVVTNQAEEHLGHDAARKLRGLRSDAAFLKAFDEGLQRALQRFVVEYEEQDEDLAAAIAEDPTIFENKEVQDALLTMLKRPGTYLVDEREQIVQTFASVLPTRKKRERVDRAVTYLLRCLAEELWHLPELQPVYSLHFQKGSYETLRQQLELQRAQLMALTELNTGLRDALLQLTDAIAAQKLLPPPQAISLPASSKVLHNLPQPEYEQFVGREQELAEVHRLLSPHVRHFLITIDGIGGIGKSALALEAAHYYLRNHEKLPDDVRFDAIIWTTAKRKVLTTEGIISRRQSLRNLDDLYTAVAVTLEREDITRARPDEQEEVVRRALTRQRTLVIVDNLETVDDEQLLVFLRELPAPTKAIVTTRHRINVAYPIRLEEMPWPDAQRLVQQECERKGVALDAENAHRLHDRTGGLPIALVLCIAQMGFGRDLETILARLGQPGDNLARFCFEESVGMTYEKPAHNLLMSLAVFSDSATRSALGYVANVPELDRDEGLVDLEILSLVNKRANRFALAPLTRDYVLTVLNSKSELSADLRRRWVDYLKSICGSIVGEAYWRFNSYQFHDDIESILDAIEWSYEHGTAEDILLLTLAANEYFDAAGEYNRLVVTCKQALGLAVSIGARLHVARFSNTLGWVYGQRGDFSSALEAFAQALDAYKAIENDAGIVVTLEHFGTIYRKQGKYHEARNVYDRAWRTALVLDDGEIFALIEAAYGKLARDMHQWELAKEHFLRASAWYEEQAEQTPRDERLARSLWGQLALVALHQDAPETAKELCLKSFELSALHGTAHFNATLKYRLALAEEALGDDQTALQHAQEAADRFDRLGMAPDYEVARVLLDRLIQKTAEQESDFAAELT